MAADELKRLHELPSLAGLYAVSVLYNGYHIYQSPFNVHVAPDATVVGGDWDAGVGRSRSPMPLKPTASFRRR